MEQIKPTFDTGLACFAIMASYFEKPISIEQVKHKYDRQDSNFEEYELLQLAKEFSLKARFIDTSWDRLDKINLPAIAQTKDKQYFVIACKSIFKSILCIYISLINFDFKTKKGVTSITPIFWWCIGYIRPITDNFTASPSFILYN